MKPNENNMQELIRNSRELRERLIADPYRPAYHITTPEGVCGPFDPNGAIFWKGRYHLMYIIQNDKGHCWAHISSKDLIHWKHHPIALEPDNADRGIFSGGASLDKNGIPTITYWGLGDPRGICIATSNDDMLDIWNKSPHNPIIKETQLGLAEVMLNGKKLIYGAADPSAIWINNGRYYMITGNLLVLREFGLNRKELEHQGDTAYLFVSDDLVNWEYLHPFYTSSRKWTQADEDDMCPDFFQLPCSSNGGSVSNRHMILFISHNLGCQYYIGTYSNDRFEPETHGRMTWVDNAFFAPESLVDEQGRRIMWAWIFDGRSNETRQSSGWSGTMSLPRVLWLGEDKTLRMAPADELEKLRCNPRELKNVVVSADTHLPLKNICGNCLELEIEFAPGQAKQFGVNVCCSEDGEEKTLVFYDTVEKALKIDTRFASLAEGPKTIESAPLELDDNESLKLRVFIDRSIIEVFANNRQAVTRSIYPTHNDAKNVQLFANGESITITRLRAWDMAETNPC